MVPECVENICGMCHEYIRIKEYVENIGLCAEYGNTLHQLRNTFQFPNASTFVYGVSHVSHLGFKSPAVYPALGAMHLVESNINDVSSA